jgi:hypothetical protein
VAATLGVMVVHASGRENASGYAEGA